MAATVMAAWKDVRPSGERLVCGDSDGVSFVSVSDELEQGTGLHLVLSDVRELIEDDEVVLVEFVEHRGETELAACGLKLLHHIGGSGKQDAATGIDEGVADGGDHVHLAGAALTENEDVAAAFDPAFRP